MTRSNHFSWATLVVLPLLACAGPPRPEARMASSEGAIRGAQEAGAQSVPAAALYLKLAEEQRQSGLNLANAGNNHRAEFMLSRSEADAELAVAVAREASAKRDANHAVEQVQDLNQKGTP